MQSVNTSTFATHITLQPKGNTMNKLSATLLSPCMLLVTTGTMAKVEMKK